MRQSTLMEAAALPRASWRRKVRCSLRPSLLQVISTSLGSISLLKPENLKCPWSSVRVHQAGVPVLDLGAHLGVGNPAAAVEVSGEAEERHPGIGIVFLVFVERSAARPGHAGNRKRERQGDAEKDRCTY